MSIPTIAVKRKLTNPSPLFSHESGANQQAALEFLAFTDSGVLLLDESGKSLEVCGDILRRVMGSIQHPEKERLLDEIQYRYLTG